MSTKVTAATITDQQIRELRAQAGADHGDAPEISDGSTAASKLWHACNTALDALRDIDGSLIYPGARELCADAWNARQGGGQ